MREFDKIYLSWRQGVGARRHIVGVIEQIETNRFAFRYLPENVKKASEHGFSPYTEFPFVDYVYNGNTIDIFAQRLTKNLRPDVQSFYDFWEIEPEYINDKFYLLGHTQGLLPTDNFEFLADYNPIPGLHFLTELAGLSDRKISSELLSESDELSFVKDPKNKHDQEAVKVFKQDLELGYIKKIHCRVFHKPGGENLKLSVKAIDKNGILRRVFIKVHNPSPNDLQRKLVSFVKEL